MSKTVVVLESIREPNNYWDNKTDFFRPIEFATNYLHECAVFNSKEPLPKEPVKIVQLLIPD